MLKNSKFNDYHLYDYILPLLGIFIIVFFIVTAYYNNYIFLGDLVASSLILTLVYIIKIINSKSHFNDN